MLILSRWHITICSEAHICSPKKRTTSRCSFSCCRFEKWAQPSSHWKSSDFNTLSLHSTPFREKSVHIWPLKIFAKYPNFLHIALSAKLQVSSENEILQGYQSLVSGAQFLNFFCYKHILCQGSFFGKRRIVMSMLHSSLCWNGN